ncbi:MAG: GSCFA domain-containing protein [Pseudomonadota bacterium]
MTSFYSSLDDRAFWKSGVAETSPLNLKDLYQKKWTISPRWQIGTAGSCFAQHIARHLRKNGYNVLDAEPPPNFLRERLHLAYGYSMYSGRYGNIYTVRQFRQLIDEAFSDTPQEMLIWEKDGRVYDALRPAIEPNGFASIVEAQEARAYHLACVRKLFMDVDLFVFTLGLTEAWFHDATGRVVPIAPGVVAGGDKTDEYSFRNFTYPELLSDFRETMKALNKHRGRRLRFLLTVSPVPLTATASGGHVLAASTYSKAVLRAVAGSLCDSSSNVDYFPSYEIITNPAARGTFFAPNLRSVQNEGVEVVMKTYFSAHPPQINNGTESECDTAEETGADVQCEEELLGAFQK